MTSAARRAAWLEAVRAVARRYREVGRGQAVIAVIEGGSARVMSEVEYEEWAHRQHRRGLTQKQQGAKKSCSEGEKSVDSAPSSIL